MSNSNVKDLFLNLWMCTNAFRQALREDSKGGILEYINKGKLSSLWAARISNERWVWKDVPLNVIPDSYGIIQNTKLENKEGSLPNDSYGDEINSFLPRILLPPVIEILFERSKKYSDLRDDILWVTYMLYDEKGGGYIYRNITNLKESIDEQILTVLYRAPEIATSFFQKYCLDFSNMMRDQIQPNYALVTSLEPLSKTQLSSILISDLIGIPNKGNKNRLRSGGDVEIVGRAGQLRMVVKDYVKIDKDSSFINLLACLNANEYGNELFDKINGLDNLIDNANIFFKNIGEYNNAKETVTSVNTFIGMLLDILIVDNNKGDTNAGLGNQYLKQELEKNAWKFANYFIWLTATHPELDSYVVRHVFDFRLENEARRRAVRPSGIVIATKGLKNLEELAARSEVLIHELLSPLTSYYARENLQAETAAMYASGAAHGFKTAIQGPKSILSIFDANQLKEFDMRMMELDEFVQDENMEEINRDILEESKDWLKKRIEAGVIAKNEVDFLADMATSMFWIMDPKRMAQEIGDSTERWDVERSIRDLVARSISRGIMKIDFKNLPDTWKGNLLMKQAEILSIIANDNNNLSCLIEFINNHLPNLNIIIKFSNNIEIIPIRLRRVDAMILNNVLYELLINAFKAAITTNKKMLCITVEKQSNNLVVKVFNSVTENDKNKLLERWSEPLVYKSGGSGGIKGILQVRTLEKRAREGCGSTVILSPPKEQEGGEMILIGVSSLVNNED